MYTMYKVNYIVSLGNLSEETFINIPAESPEKARDMFWRLYERVPAIRTANTFWPLHDPASSLKIMTVTHIAKGIEVKTNELQSTNVPALTSEYVLTKETVVKGRRGRKKATEEQKGIKPSATMKRKR